MFNNFLDRIGLERLATIRLLFVWGKGIRFKEHFRGTYPDNGDIQYIPIHLQLIEVQEPQRRRNALLFFSIEFPESNHSFNLAPLIPYSAGGGPKLIKCSG